jgi:hypothetical protein
VLPASAQAARIEPFETRTTGGLALRGHVHLPDGMHQLRALGGNLVAVLRHTAGVGSCDELIGGAADVGRAMLDLRHWASPGESRASPLTGLPASGCRVSGARRGVQAAWGAGSASATSTVSAGAFCRLDRARNGSARTEIPADIR